MAQPAPASLCCFLLFFFFSFFFRLAKFSTSNERLCDFGLHQRRRGVQTQRDKWEEVGEMTVKREKGGVREQDTEAMLVEAPGEREGERES